MSRLALIACVTWSACCVGQQVEKPDGWKTLLSDRTCLKDNWSTTGNWILAEGIVKLSPRAEEKGWKRWTDYLWSKTEYSDFVIEFEYRLQAHGNSGFYFRVGDVNDPVQQGIEVQIFDSIEQDRNKLSDHDAGGIIPGLKPHRPAAKPAGEWNKMQVASWDNKVVVRLNDVTVNAHDMVGGGQLSKRPRTGVIGFQDHGSPIELRNIRIKQLGQNEAPW